MKSVVGLTAHAPRRSLQRVRRSGWILVACSLGCSATIDGTRGLDGGAVDAGAPDAGAVDAGGFDTSTGCRWQAVGGARVLRQSTTELLLAEAVSTGDGAALTVWEAGALRVLRVDGEAAPDPARPDGWTLATDTPRTVRDGVSMLWRPETQRAEVLWPSQSTGALCQWSAVDAAGVRSRAVTVDPEGSRFALTGCRDLALEDGVRTFLSEQVRATWGNTVLTLDDTGVARARYELPMALRPPSLPVQRTVLPEGGSWMLWVEGGSAHTLYARRVSAMGNPLDDPSAVRVADGPTMTEMQALAPTGGALAVWTEESSPSRLPRRWVRPIGPGAGDAPAVALEALGAPVAAAHATARGAEVLSAAVVGSGVLRTVLMRHDARGGGQTEASVLPMSFALLPIGRVRVVATTAGALVFLDGRLTSGASAVVGLPVACR